MGEIGSEVKGVTRGIEQAKTQETTLLQGGVRVKVLSIGLDEFSQFKWNKADYQMKHKYAKRLQKKRWFSTTR